MRFEIAILLSFGLLFVNAKEQKEQEHERREHRHEEHHKEESRLKMPFGGEPKTIKMEEQAKEKLLKEKSEHVFYEKEIEYFLKNPNTNLDLQCFDNFIKPGQSIDFVIDLAPSPNQDKIDKLSAESPVGLFLERIYRTPSRAYFSAVQLFIEAVTYGMKPETTHSIIYDNGRKFFIRGREVEDEESLKKLQSGGEFTDKKRNLKTLWPVPTKDLASNLGQIVKNNLGCMTKLALWNRNNGLPVVLNANRRSKPIYTIVISDGASGAKLHQLTDDLSRTTVVDVGNRRFVNNISWEDMDQLKGVFTLVAPQKLPMLIDTCRAMACLFGKHASQKS